MGWFGESEFKIGDKVFVPVIDLEGTIIDITGDSCMVEVYGDNMRRSVEVFNKNRLKRV